MLHMGCRPRTGADITYGGRPRTGARSSTGPTNSFAGRRRRRPPRRRGRRRGWRRRRRRRRRRPRRRWRRRLRRRRGRRRRRRRRLRGRGHSTCSRRSRPPPARWSRSSSAAACSSCAGGGCDSMVKVQSVWAPVPPRGAPGGSGQLGTPKKRPPTALGARASRLQSRRFHWPLTTHLLCDCGGMRETQGALGPSRRKVDRFFEHPGFEVRLVVLARFIGALEWHQHEAIYMHIHMYMYIHTRLGRPRHVRKARTQGTYARHTEGHRDFYSIYGCLIVAGSTP